MIRKAVIIGPAHPLRGGIANTDESLCRALGKAGVESKIISFSLQYPGFLFPGKSQFTDDPAPEGITIENRINSINPFTWLYAASAINRFLPDLVIARYWLPFMAPALGTIVRLARRPAVRIAVTDNVIPHEHRPGDRMLTKYFLKPFDGFVALSASVADELKMFTSKRTEYFPHPMNDNVGEKVDKAEASARLGLDPAYSHILFFGLVRKYKGLDLLLDALSDSRLKERKIKLLVVGEFYDNKDEYLDMIRSHGLQDKVIIRDEFIPSEEVKYYFSASDIVAQTYHTASQSGVAQVAYNFETPLLVTDVGGLGEIVPHGRTGFVAKKDPADIAARLEEFFEKDLYAEFSTNMKEEKKRFSWDIFARNLIDMAGSLK